jgi:hypothetical protein
MRQKRLRALESRSLVILVSQNITDVLQLTLAVQAVESQLSHPSVRMNIVVVERSAKKSSTLRTSLNIIIFSLKAGRGNRSIISQ